MLSSGWKFIIVRLTFDLWLSVAIFALPVYFGYVGAAIGLIIFPFYIEAALFYFIANLAFSLPTESWSPFVFWQTIVALLLLAIIMEVKALILKDN